MRFLIHICFVVVIAPVYGAAAYVALYYLAEGRIHELMGLRGLLGLALRAFYFVGFFAFVTFPFALLSSFLCYRMAKLPTLTLRSWVSICGLLGSLLGVLMCLWSQESSAWIWATIGAFLGAISGPVVQKAWKYDWEEHAIY